MDQRLTPSSVNYRFSIRDRLITNRQIFPFFINYGLPLTIAHHPSNIRHRAAHKNRSFERVVMDQGYYTDPVRRSESAAISRGVKGMENRNSAGTKNSSGSSSSSSSSSSKYNQTVPGDGLHRQNNNLEWSGPGSISASTVNYCNVYINTSNSSIGSASIESGVDDNTLLPYLSIAALPSKTSTRYFCSVCGYFGTYTCTRCGCRFCCTKCLLSHKETRCLKFSY